MIDDKTGISAATAKSHKQVIWDLQALSCFHVAVEEECSGSLAHTHTHTHTHTHWAPAPEPPPPTPPPFAPHAHIHAPTVLG